VLRDKPTTIAINSVRE